MITARLMTLVGAACLVSTVARAEDLQIDFTPAAYLRHVQYLADDDREGRSPGSDGIEQAAAYIADQLAAAGLSPAGVDGGWYQPFTVASIKDLDESAAGLTSARGGDWAFGRDFAPFPFTEPGEVSGPLAFAGYGIEAPEYGYNDYADFDATGKVLLIFRHEPKDADPDAKFGGESPSPHALFVRKARTAARHGAIGLLIVDPPNRATDDDALYEWSQRETRSTYSLPMMHVSRGVANALLKQARMPDIAVLQEELDAGRESLTTDLREMEVTIRTGVSPVETRNVIGVLRGAAQPDEYVVVGAHYDHVGIGRPRRGGDEPQVHNGADDNASGTAGMIELARVIAAGPRPKRSMIFMAFSAEESGLLGSEWFVEHPTVPIEQIKAMMNFDMIGRLSQDKLTIFGMATGREFEEMVAEAAEPEALKYTGEFSVTGIFTRSDHYNFFTKGVPVLFPFTGLHGQYHRPGDDWELIDPVGATRLLRFARTLLVGMANMETGPTYHDPEAEAEEAESVADAGAGGPSHEAAADQPVAVPRLTVRMGIAPAMTSEGEGMLVNTVSPGSAAEKAGMQKGDRIVRIAETAIVTPRDYMSAVRGYSPGDQVDVTVRRGEEDKVLKVTFDAPAGAGS